MHDESAHMLHAGIRLLLNSHTLLASSVTEGFGRLKYPEDPLPRTKISSFCRL